jgi:hypothetical protein
MAKNPVLQASPNPEGMLVFMPALNLAITATWNLMARNPVLQARPYPDGMLVFMPVLNLAINTWSLKARNPVLQASPKPDNHYLERDGQESCSSCQP